RQSGPSLSIVHDSAIAPVRGTRPNVGRSPVAPFTVDGDEIEPSVSLPIANPTSPPEVADAGPADEPLDPYGAVDCASAGAVGCHGFLVRHPVRVFSPGPAS